MSLILLILQIITAIPGIIKVIKEIMDLISGLRGVEKKEAESQLREVLKRHKAAAEGVTACPEKCKLDLEQLRENLKNKHGI